MRNFVDRGAEKLTGSQAPDRFAGDRRQPGCACSPGLGMSAARALGTFVPPFGGTKAGNPDAPLDLPGHGRFVGAGIGVAVGGTHGADDAGTGGAAGAR